MRHLRCFPNYLYFCCITVAVTSGYAGCYSFTGASVPQHWKTIAVPIFDDDSNYGEPGLRERITNAVIQKLQRDNTLRLTDRSASDVVLVGTIMSIKPDEPVALVQGDRASRYRITATLKISLQDKVQKKQVWEKQFSAYGDYGITSGASQKDVGLQTAIDKLSDDIILETLSGW